MHATPTTPGNPVRKVQTSNTSLHLDGLHHRSFAALIVLHGTRGGLLALLGELVFHHQHRPTGFLVAQKGVTLGGGEMSVPVVEIPLHVGDYAVFVKADRFRYVELILQPPNAPHSDADFRRLNETQQRAVVLVLAYDVLA